MRRQLSRWFTAATWREFADLIVNLGVGIATFTWAVTLVSTSAGLFVTLVGIPLMAFTVMSGRWIAGAERSRVKGMLGDAIPAPRPVRVPDGGGLRPMFARLKDGAGWKGLLYGIVMLPIGIATFTIAVTLTSVGIGGVTYPAWFWMGSNEKGQWWQGTNMLHDGRGRVLIVAYVVVGFFVLVATPAVMHGLARMHAGIARGLLGDDGKGELEERVEQLTESRDASVSGAVSELRRIERDLHDGAQQRMVSVAMELGLARERLDRGASPEQARELIVNAHEEAKRAVGDLRDLVRGIHPAVLTDRGLDAALSAVAARCPMPVDVSVDLPARPPAPVEAALYFIASEALTNTAKHSKATKASVRIVATASGLSLTASDNGVGGATIEPSGGLVGLRDRVASVEGTFRLMSPQGGPTTMIVDVPCRW